ncbi:hypothetical protein Srubr_61610 [Streptomyces rubradiris]|uniref:Uncharacterized protein n=1 Tax=Streptomyces rubradiris TaxID=285531 RepID=A0ABQ3RKC3_STRRR|nr:hypothetical protein Srubr_61610 [Streptomyces rubradiris]
MSVQRFDRHVHQRPRRETTGPSDGPRTKAPAPKQPPHEEFEHGRGLALVEAHAARWGITFFGGFSPRSKAVWFEHREAAEVRGAGAIRPDLP